MPPPEITTPAHPTPSLESGTAGLIGAATMLAADCLLYAHWDPMPAVSPAVESILAARTAILLATPEQLILSSLLGPIAAALYVWGAWHVFARLRPASPRWAAAAGALLAILSIQSGAFHAMWGPFGFVAQAANGQPALSAELLEPVARSMRVFIDVQTLVALPLLLVMLALVARGGSTYPRWTVLMNPVLLYAIGVPLLTPFANAAPSPYGALILGGMYNALMVSFFLMSICTRPRPWHAADRGAREAA